MLALPHIPPAFARLKNMNCTHAFVALVFLIHLQYVSTRTLFVGGIFQEGAEIEELAFDIAITLTNRKYSASSFNLTLNSYKKRIFSDPVIDAKRGILLDRDWNKPFESISAACFLMTKGVGAIFSQVAELNSYAVQSVCDAKEIPVVQTKPNYHSSKYQLNTINLFPHVPLLAKALVDLVTSLKWNHITVLYDNEYSLFGTVAELVKFDSHPPNKVVVRQLKLNPYKKNYMDVLKSVRSSGQFDFILDCSTKNLNTILDQLQKVGLMMEDYRYILANLDTHLIDMTPYQHTKANFTFLRLFEFETKRFADVSKLLQKRSNLTAVSLSTSNVLLIDAISHFGDIMFKHTAYKPKPLLCDTEDSWEHGSTLFNYMKTLTSKGLSGRVEFDQYGFRSHFSLDIMELTERGAFKLGSWNSAEGLKMDKLEPRSETPHGYLKNVSLVVAIAIAEPYAMLRPASGLLTGNSQYEGFSIDLINELALMQGFEYTFIRNPDDKNGNYDKSSDTWDGIMGDVLSGTADLAIGDLTITRERKQFVDFTAPFMSLGIQILGSKPKKAAPGFFSFADPFHPHVWFLLCVTIPLMSLAFYVIGRICPEEWYNPHPCVEEPRYLVNQYHFSNCVWLIIANLTQEGSEVAPRGCSTRIMASFWSFFILLIVNLYTANMTAFLTTEKEIWLFESASELVERTQRSGLKYGAVTGGSTHKFFVGSIDPVFGKIGDFMKNHPEYMHDHFSYGVEMAEEDDRYAFFMESSTIKYVTQRKCNLTEVGDYLDHKFYGIAMRKNSTYRNLLSTAVLKLVENGKIDELERKWWEKERGGGNCGIKEADGAPPLRLQHVSGIFWITLYGTLLALIVAILEAFLEIYRKHKAFKKFVKPVSSADNINDDSSDNYDYVDNVR